MTPKQKALANNIPKFIQKIDATGANHHVGIATSDVGSNVQPGVPWAATSASATATKVTTACFRPFPHHPQHRDPRCAQRLCAALPRRPICPHLWSPLHLESGWRDQRAGVDGKDPVSGKMVDVGLNKAFGAWRSSVTMAAASKAKWKAPSGHSTDTAAKTRAFCGPTLCSRSSSSPTKTTARFRWRSAIKTTRATATAIRRSPTPRVLQRRLPLPGSIDPVQRNDAHHGRQDRLQGTREQLPGARREVLSIL